ncbi:hypothetical protein [Pseudomonas sp. HY7a-MNA-CIBAN-0227]|uniref:hypothetical protein n=1 Tax=Pseudomonas sp. HY7a-MNA-CIBAN-0227 TaxID=3140474 RepID=UPI0033179ED5
MNKIPESSLPKAKEVRDIALALISGEAEKIVASEYINKHDYYNEDGSKIADFDEAVYETYSYDLNQSSSYILTAYELDKQNYSQIAKYAGDYEFATNDNCDKLYIEFEIYHSPEIKGSLVISNDGEYHIVTTDGSFRILKLESGEFDTTSPLYNLADQIALRHEQVHFDKIQPERGFEESAHYYKIADINYFHSDEEYKEYKLDHLRAMSDADLSRASHHNAVRYLLDSSDETSHIIVEDSDYSSDRSFIMEVDGNIFYHERNGKGIMAKSSFKFVEEGDDFTFKGTEATAGKDILQAFRMGLVADGFTIEEKHVENDKPEPEVKKTRTLKPGR